MAHDHLKKASSSSQDESDKDESLSTRKSETELLSPSERITPLIPIVGKIKAGEAEAKIKVATAQGNAEALLANARAEAESNKLRQQTLTPMFIQQQWIEKWKGNVPTTQLGGSTQVMYGLK